MEENYLNITAIEKGLISSTNPLTHSGYLDEHKNDHFKLTLKTSFTILVIAGPVFLYLTQYFTIARQKSIGTFNPLLCFIIIMAGILRT